MPHALPARKVAGNKTGAVRRQRNQARQVQPKGPKVDYTEALRNKCRHGALHRKPATPNQCPECSGKGCIITKLGFAPGLAAKWFQTCTRTVKNLQGEMVRCSYYKVPPQPLPSKKQIAVIERQRAADLAAYEVTKARRTLERVERDAGEHPEDNGLQLDVALAKKTLEDAVAKAQVAQELAKQDDERGWETTPPPQPSSSRVTLDVANHSSATSVRTSTSQAQLDHDREVALNLQNSIWDAETNDSPDSTRTADTSPDKTGRPSAGRPTDRHTDPPARSSDTTNRMRQAARLQKQAADWLGEESVTSKIGTKDIGPTASSSPIATPTPAGRTRNLRPFPLTFAPDRDQVGDSMSGSVDRNGGDDEVRVKPKSGSEKSPVNGKEAANKEGRRNRSPSFNETPPPSTQPRSLNNTVKKRRRSLSLTSVISISSDEPPRTQVKRQRTEPEGRVKRETFEETITPVRSTTDGNTESGGDAANRPSKPKPRPVRKSAGAAKATTRAERDAVTAKPTTNAPTIGSSLDIGAPPAPHIDAAVATSLAELVEGNFRMQKPERGMRDQPVHGASTGAGRNSGAANGARSRHQPAAQLSEAAPSSDRENATSESTLGSSNKENYDVSPGAGRPPSLGPSPFVKPRDDNDKIPDLLPLDDTEDDIAPYSRARHLRALPREEPHVHPITHLPGGAYDISCRLSCCVMVEENETGRAPWESDYDSDDVATGLSAERDVEDAVDEGEASEDDDRDHVHDGASIDEPPFDEHEGLGGLSRNSSDSEDPQVDDVADDGRHLYVEESVDAAVKKPWTHDLDEVEAWYCTVFLWIVNDGRPRQVLLSMNTGETEVRLSDRPPVYTALGGLRPSAIRLWDFTTSTWVAQDLDTVFSVSEFDQHTLLIRLPEVTRCLEFGKAIAYAEEPLWPALTEPAGADDELPSNGDNKHAGDVQRPTNVTTSRHGTPTAGTTEQGQERSESVKTSRKGKEVERPKAVKMSRKGKEVARD